MTTGEIRQPAVAGFFYPGNPETLRRDVDAMLDAAPPSATTGTIRAMVSPHAGYPYSGAIAAHGFQSLRPQAVRTVVMIGPSHVEYFDFSSVYCGDAYETPLGPVTVNAELGRALTRDHSSIQESHHGHVQPELPRGEHGLEVQLPFLQRTHPDASIVPIVMGSQDLQACRELGEALAAHCGPGDVILASSDLSHFYDYDTAVEMDTAFLGALATLDPDTLFQAVAQRECEACGAGPVVAALLATGGDATDRRYSLLARANSGDVSGDRNSVVGYASAVVTSSDRVAT